MFSLLGGAGREGAGAENLTAVDALASSNWSIAANARTIAGFGLPWANAAGSSTKTFWSASLREW
jgi:hypothetical protein